MARLAGSELNGKLKQPEAFRAIAQSDFGTNTVTNGAYDPESPKATPCGPSVCVECGRTARTPARAPRPGSPGSTVLDLEGQGGQANPYRSVHPRCRPFDCSEQRYPTGWRSTRGRAARCLESGSDRPAAPPGSRSRPRVPVGIGRRPVLRGDLTKVADRLMPHLRSRRCGQEPASCGSPCDPGAEPRYPVRSGRCPRCRVSLCAGGQAPDAFA